MAAQDPGKVEHAASGEDDGAEHGSDATDLCCSYLEFIGFHERMFSFALSP